MNFISKLINLYFDRNRSEKEYKIVIRTLERMNQRMSVYNPIGNFKDQREMDFDDLNNIPKLYWTLQHENDRLNDELKKYKNLYENRQEIMNDFVKSLNIIKIEE